MKYKCPRCEEIFEGELPACPKCGQKMVYPEKKEIVPKQEEKPAKKNPLLGLAIAAIVISVIGCIAYPFLVLNLTGSVNHLFDKIIPDLVQGLWKAMVRELFTFIFFCIIVVFAVLGVLIGALAVVALGPVTSFIALILALVACIHKYRRWYSFMALGFVLVTIVVDVLTIIAFFSK